MRKPIIIISIIIIMVFSCRREYPYATLTGWAYYYGISIPIGEVRIKVGENITYTASDGSFYLPDIRKGTYRLRADKEGFDPYSVEIRFMEDNMFQNVELTSDDLTHKVYGSVTGDYSGEPRSGLKLVFMNHNGTRSQLKAVTDSLGSYEIEGLPKGYHLMNIFSDNDLIYEEYIEVLEEDVSHDIFLSDILEFEDSRDGNIYSALKIDSLTWMIENLAYLPIVYSPESISERASRYYVYDYIGEDVGIARLSQNYQNYGVLYNWNGANTSCPEGWHLPTDEEWKSLEKYLGMDEFDALMDKWRNSGEVGHQLKSTEDWLNDGNGDNSSWFNALPGGFIDFNFGSKGINNTASFWTSTKCVENVAWQRTLKAEEDGVFRLCNYTRYAYSVRCVQ